MTMMTMLGPSLRVQFALAAAIALVSIVNVWALYYNTAMQVLLRPKDNNLRLQFNSQLMAHMDRRAVTECLTLVNASKKTLLESIASYQRRDSATTITDIFRSVEVLEGFNSTFNENCIEGAWSLIYSAQIAGKKFTSDDSDGLFGQLLSNTYKQIFRLAPFLAGSQNAYGAKIAIPSADGQFQNSAPQQLVRVTNTQTIDLQAQRLTNKVVITSGTNPKLKLSIIVNGVVKLLRDKPGVIEAVFTSCSVGGIPIPLPRPRGLIETTFCDGDMRVTRGSKGGLFILKKMKS